MAPEVLTKNKYSEKADVYSFGIVLFEIFSGERPYDTGEFAQMNQAQLMYQIIEKEARPSLDGLAIGLQQLITDCWDLDPRLRPSFSETIVRLRRLKFEKEEKNKSLAIDIDESDSLLHFDNIIEGSLTTSSDLSVPYNTNNSIN